MSIHAARLVLRLRARVQQHVLQVFELRRFAQVVVKARCQRPLAVRHRGIARKRNQTNGVGRSIGAKSACQLVTVKAWQADVDQRDLGLVRFAICNAISPLAANRQV